MSRQLAELESIMQQLVAEHEKLLAQLDAQQAAMKQLDLQAIEQAASAQEALRLRIASLETRRRAAVQQIASALRLQQPVTIATLAQALPQHGETLLDLRHRLRELITRLSSRTQVAGRLAGALLGHLNTVVRLLAGAVEQAGLYTKQGTPHVSPRIGVLETVG